MTYILKATTQQDGSFELDFGSDAEGAEAYAEVLRNEGASNVSVEVQ